MPDAWRQVTDPVLLRAFAELHGRVDFLERQLGTDEREDAEQDRESRWLRRLGTLATVITAISLLIVPIVIALIGGPK